MLGYVSLGLVRLRYIRFGQVRAVGLVLVRLYLFRLRYLGNCGCPFVVRREGRGGSFVPWGQIPRGERPLDGAGPLFWGAVTNSKTKLL